MRISPKVEKFLDFLISLASEAVWSYDVVSNYNTRDYSSVNMYKVQKVKNYLWEESKKTSEKARYLVWKSESEILRDCELETPEELLDIFDVFLYRGDYAKIAVFTSAAERITSYIFYQTKEQYYRDYFQAILHFPVLLMLPLLCGIVLMAYYIISDCF